MTGGPWADALDDRRLDPLWDALLFGQSTVVQFAVNLLVGPVAAVAGRAARRDGASEEIVGSVLRTCGVVLSNPDLVHAGEMAMTAPKRRELVALLEAAAEAA